MLYRMAHMIQLPLSQGDSFDHRDFIYLRCIGGLEGPWYLFMSIGTFGHLYVQHYICPYVCQYVCTSVVLWVLLLVLLFVHWYVHISVSVFICSVGHLWVFHAICQTILYLRHIFIMEYQITGMVIKSSIGDACGGPGGINYQSPLLISYIQP